MPPYKIDILKRAEKDILALASVVRARIRRKVQTLADDPRPRACKKLRGSHYYRVRVGDYRIVYHIDDDNKVVTIERIKHRKDV